MNSKQIIVLVLISVGFLVSGIFSNLISNNGIFNKFIYDIGVALGYLICFFQFIFIIFYLKYRKELSFKKEKEKEKEA